MAPGIENKEDEPLSPGSVYDADPADEDDLWFLPGPPEDAAPTDPPWPIAPREATLAPRAWAAAEAECYRDLVEAAQAVTRFGERLRTAPEGVAARLALQSVVAVLRGEGVWLSPEQVALFRELRLGSDDTVRDLARASWACRRLEAGNPPDDDLHDFLGRIDVHDARTAPGDDRPVGDDLTALGRDWAAAQGAMGRCHPLTRAAHGFAAWRTLGLAPWDEMLEPSAAAMLIGAQGLAPFLPMAPGHRLDRHGLSGTSASPKARLVTFYAAAQAGAVAACMELDRLGAWRDRAVAATSDLSGRTPPALIAALLRHPVLSAELAAETTGASRPSARRNLNLFADRGLVRELTGQDRYRFWTVTA